MGLTISSTGRHVATNRPDSKNRHKDDTVVALAGNPNVGKSTVFNALTGMHQHTGNWPGKTVGNAIGRYTYKNDNYILVDIPGSYSLSAHSTEEEIARDFICFGKADAVVVVCDATCLLRNLNLVLQILEITQNVVVCVNLIDEAKRKHIFVDCDALSASLGVPVVAVTARNKTGLPALTEEIRHITKKGNQKKENAVKYRPEIEEAIAEITPAFECVMPTLNTRWVALRLLEEDVSFLASLKEHLKLDFNKEENVVHAVKRAKKNLATKGLDDTSLRDALVADLYQMAENICQKAVRFEDANYMEKQLKIDKLLTSKSTGIPLMILLLLAVLWLTTTGANYPSALLSRLLFGLQDQLTAAFFYLGAPDWLHGILVLGVYRVLAWVVAVMLPPMAIFFPLFTLLEDLGYLPRIAFNLDNTFRKCQACGKQALTMCMGFGCNAAGVIGCRIIDSERERLIAVLTNSFVPCNGRFPTLIAIITMFFALGPGGFLSSLMAATLLTLVILVGIGITMLTSRLLSATVLKGVPSSFTLELPPYRRPQIGKILIRSVFDRTLFVLGRAVSVAAPAGLIIYLMANITLGGASLLAHCSGFLDPFARIFGLDGVILMAFILGFPANEIVIPIAIMAYMSGNTITEFENLKSLRTLLVENGWTWLTAACTMIFSLLHWPCSTTLISIKKETGSWRWTLLGFLLPTAAGFLLCFALTTIVRLLIAI